MDRCGERKPRLARSGCERGRADERSPETKRQLDTRRAPFERTELLHHRARCCGPVEDAPRLRGLNDDPQAVAHDRSVHRHAVHVFGDQAELVLQRAVEDRRRRRHVSAEDLHVEALEPSNRAETVPLALCGGDRRLPVRLDAELARADRVALAAGEEHDRLVRNGVGTPLQQRARILRVHPPDVDAVDRHAVRKGCRRTGEDEAQHDGRGDDREQQKKEAPAHATNVARPAAGARRRRARRRRKR
jgi:hypothetical protein